MDCEQIPGKSAKCVDCEYDTIMEGLSEEIRELAESFFKYQEAETINLGQVGKYLLLGVKVG